MEFIYNDGGRKEAGYKGKAGDCVCRAIAIITERPYKDVYKELQSFIKLEGKQKISVRNGIPINIVKKYLSAQGFKWISCMKIGQGCKVHLKKEEIPAGKLLVRISKHITTVIDKVIYDIYNPQREGSRCVYGYWIKNR